MTQDGYTGAQATFSYAGATIAYAEVDLTLTRGVAAFPRANKYSDYKLPGKLDFQGTVKRIQVDGQWLAALLNATPTTGTAGTLEAAATFTAGTAIPINDAAPTTPSRIRVTLSVDALTTGGTLVIYGTDVNSNAISEVLTLANGSVAGTYWTTNQTFKTCTYALPVGIASTGGGKLAFTALDGDSTANVGEPKYWNMVATASDSTNNIVITANNCFFTKGSFKVGDADKGLIDEMTFTMLDPDSDLTVSYVNA